MAGQFSPNGPTREECLALLATAHLGRIALSIEALPVVMPVGFALLDDDIVFRSPLEEKLASATLDVVLAFQADEFDASSWAGWSVLAQGLSRAVTAPDEITRCRALALPEFGAGTQDDRFARLATTRLVGRRFAALFQ